MTRVYKVVRNVNDLLDSTTYFNLAAFFFYNQQQDIVRLIDFFLQDHNDDNTII